MGTWTSFLYSRLLQALPRVASHPPTPPAAPERPPSLEWDPPPSRAAITDSVPSSLNSHQWRYRDELAAMALRVRTCLSGLSAHPEANLLSQLELELQQHADSDSVVITPAALLPLLSRTLDALDRMLASNAALRAEAAAVRREMQAGLAPAGIEDIDDEADDDEDTENQPHLAPQQIEADLAVAENLTHKLEQEIARLRSAHPAKCPESHVGTTPPAMLMSANGSLHPIPRHTMPHAPT
ncbi:hypothetical protein CDCA_CDCA03G1154 [Cyanidium caldarium]|uniref:Uncharacterized protein n=1 Tax=Cyanidium caldarium TaxID=2771 RepID=A0AAV9ISJ9_CYACA|nr:hypothetical protein CDCA_CDCA03G1154 [Cyanidium caldarium]